MHIAEVGMLITRRRRRRCPCAASPRLRLGFLLCSAVQKCNGSRYGLSTHLVFRFCLCIPETCYTRLQETGYIGNQDPAWVIYITV